MAIEVFRKWYDIVQVPQPYQRIAVYDATNDIFREDVILRIGTLSSTFGFPAQQDAISQTLAA